MRDDDVARIEIDAAGRLLVAPASETFPYMWREAMEVHWDDARAALYAPPPRKWSRARWLRQVLDAARAQGVVLRVTGRTEWVGVAPNDRAAMTEEAQTGGEAHP